MSIHKLKSAVAALSRTNWVGEACAEPTAGAAKSRLVSGLGAIALVLLAGISSAPAGELAVAPLPDGRLQLFAVAQGRLFSAWKRTPDPDSQWTPMRAFDPPPPGSIKDVTVGRLPDGRLQIFVIGSEGLITSWKRTPNPSSGWTDWIQFEGTPSYSSENP